MSNETIIIILIVLILLSAFFSSSETAFSSCNRIRIKYLANNGNKQAGKTLELLEDFGSLISAVLIGNNVVNIVSASLATVIFVRFFNDKGVTYSSIVMTVLVLIFGEIVPKTLAKQSPEKYAISVTPFISFLMIILKPLTFLFSKLEGLLEGIVTDEDSDQFRSEEFITMVEEANEEGDMDDHEADLITNAIEFNDVDVDEILTPRVDVVAVDIDNSSMDEIEKLFRDSGYSRLPVYKDDLDHIIGVLHEKDFYYLFYTKAKTPIKKILKDVIYTSEHVKVSALLRRLQKEKSHLAVVLDEYGGTSGIITMEDILEELVGEIYDEHDEVIEYYTKIDDSTYIINCELDIDELFEHFNIKPDEEEYDFNTTSAWVIHMMDRIPEVGESFEYENMKVTVTDADEKLVNKIKIVFKDKEEN